MSMPCVDSLNHCGTVCPWRVTMTREQAEDEERQFAEYLTFITGAVSRVKRIASRHNSQGIIQCPKCGGDLWWTWAALNGHTSGDCRTEGCLAWIE
jgi:hypothetical protein